MTEDMNKSMIADMCQNMQQVQFEGVRGSRTQLDLLK